jgi:Transglycosylase SLT domain
MSRSLALILAVLGLATAGRAEIVVLDNGRFLKSSAYRVEGDRARIELEGGGFLVLPIVRVDAVYEDEVGEPQDIEKAEARSLEPPESIYLGFSPEDQAPETPYGDFILSVAMRRNVNPNLVAAIMRAESGFDEMAVSHKGARGLMQLMPSTGKRLGFSPDDLFDAEINIEAGVSYLEQLIDRYPGDLPLVLAAYNAGEGAVERHKGVPPFRETHDYIRQIYTLLGMTPSPEAAPAPAPGK